jgi:hypothetical protein
MSTTIRVVAVAGLESYSLLTDAATRTAYKNNKNVWDFKVIQSPFSHHPALTTTWC